MIICSEDLLDINLQFTQTPLYLGAISKISGVKKVTLEKEENGWKFMRIRVDYGNDLREEIMHLGSKRDWLIREIHFQRSKLEDAYIEMVQSKSN